MRWFVLACITVIGVAHADETCNSPYISQLIKGQEDYVYVWTLGVEGLGDGSDKLVTIDVNPKSKRYGKVISKVSTGSASRRTTWDSPTTGATCGRRAVDNRIWVFDVGRNPAAPKLVRTIDDLGENRDFSAAHLLRAAGRMLCRRCPTRRTRAADRDGALQQQGRVHYLALHADRRRGRRLWL